MLDLPASLKWIRAPICDGDRSVSIWLLLIFVMNFSCLALTIRVSIVNAWRKSTRRSDYFSVRRQVGIPHPRTYFPAAGARTAEMSYTTHQPLIPQPAPPGGRSIQGPGNKIIHFLEKSLLELSNCSKFPPISLRASLLSSLFTIVRPSGSFIHSFLVNG